MECPLEHRDRAGILLAYCSGRLAGEPLRSLERHFDECLECRKIRDVQSTVWQALEEWTPEPVSTDFNRRLYGRIGQEAAAPWWRRLLRPAGFAGWRPAFSLASVALVTLGALLVNSPGAPPAVPPQTRAETVDVEQVERSLDDLDMLRQLAPVKSEGAAAEVL
jgi:hypothetical protein